MRGEQPLKRRDFLLGSRVQRKTEQDDPGVRKLALEDEITEILVIGDEDALLAMGDVQDFPIRDSGWIVTPNPGAVVAVVD